MSCSFGEKIKITIFGQSHSEAMGVVIDGLPAGFELDLEKIQNFLNRRAPGRNAMSTSRAEADKFNIVSGAVNGITCGAPLCAIIENTNQRSGDYDKLKALPRPSHSDFAAYMKHNGFNDIRGGGNFSGRLTAPLCFAGAVIMQMLEKKGVPTHYVEELNERETVVKKVSIVPLEVIIRNVSAGSFAKRCGVEEGIAFDEPTIEFSYKNDDLGDPLINSYHAIALKLATREEIETIKAMAFKVNEVMKEYFKLPLMLLLLFLPTIVLRSLPNAFPYFP